MSRKRLMGAASLVMAAAIALAGCGGSSGGSPNNGGSTPLSTQLDTNATLVFADPFQNDTIDPAKNESGFPTRQLDLVYDRLIGITPEGKLVPQLATSWDFPDSTTLVLKLRSGVKFQDGNEFNADAVVKNINRSMTLPAASATVKTPSKSIASVTAVDPLTVQIKLKQPRYSIVYDLAQNLGMMISPAAMSGNLDTQAVGAGMYKLVDFKPGVSATYKRWDGYWDPSAVKLAGFEIQSIADAQTRLNAVQSGQVTMSLIDENQVDSAKSAGLTVIDKPTSSAWTIFVNLTRGPLGDARVRQAISYALDRDTLVKTLAYGHGEPVVQFFPPGDPSYSPDWPASKYAYNPDKAKQLLTEAGHPNGVTLSFLVLNRPLDKQMAQAIQQMLKQANITVNLQVVEPARFDIFTGGKVDLFMGRWGGRADPADTLASNAAKDGFINPGGGTTAKFQSLIDQIGATPIGEQRTTLVQEASAEFAAEQLDIPIFAHQSIFAENGCVVGFTPYTFGADEYRGVGIKAGCKN